MQEGGKEAGCWMEEAEREERKGGGVRLIWSAASSWQHRTYSNLAREAKFINNPGEKCLQR